MIYSLNMSNKETPRKYSISDVQAGIPTKSAYEKAIQEIESILRLIIKKVGRPNKPKHQDNSSLANNLARKLLPNQSNLIQATLAETLERFSSGQLKKIADE